MAGIFAQAYNKIATVGIATKGFSSCGIWPFNPEIFNNEDFMPSSVTDIPQQTNDNNETITSVSNVTESAPPIPEPVRPQINAWASTSSDHALDSQSTIESVCATPKASAKRKTGRKAERAEIITASPFKKSLLAKKESKSSANKSSVSGKGKSKKKNYMTARRMKNGHVWFAGRNL